MWSMEQFDHQGPWKIEWDWYYWSVNQAIHYHFLYIRENKRRETSFKFTSSFQGSMHRACGLVLGPKCGVRSVADKKFYLRLTVKKRLWLRNGVRLWFLSRNKQYNKNNTTEAAPILQLQKSVKIKVKS